VPVAWSTWLTRTVPDQAESAGGLLVAAIQFAIAIGASMGGIVFGLSGVTGVFAASSAVLLLTALIILAGIRLRPAATMA
jgi:predicted MFS family arabinose efflux permease